MVFVGWRWVDERKSDGGVAVLGAIVVVDLVEVTFLVEMQIRSLQAVFV